MQGKKILTVMAMLCLCLMGLAQAKDEKNVETYEADSLLRTADIYYKSGDYQNALKSAQLASLIFNKTKDELGLTQSSTLIATIESVLSPNQLADIYVNIAGGYFVLDATNMDAMQKAIVFGEKAKKIYLEVGGTFGTSGVLKSDDIISGARKNIDNERNKCIRDGDDMFQKGQNSMFLGSFLAAYNYATNASATYTKCPYQIGIDQSAALITAINNKIGTIKAQSKAAYDQAVKFFTMEQYERCISTAADAQGLYASVGDKDAASSAISIMSQCQERINNKKDYMRRQADQYKKEAEYLSVIPDCFNATDRANKAKAIYVQLREDAHQKEKDLPKNQQTETYFWNTLVSEVDGVLNRIETICTEGRTIQMAENYYQQSLELYTQNQLNEAKTYAENAKSIFEKLKEFVGISKTETLINKIDMRISQMNDADEALSRAYKDYSVAEFERASTDASRAQAIYKNIKLDEKATEAGKLMENIRSGIGKLEQANNLYGKARNYLDQEQLDLALSSAQKSNQLYKEVNYTFGINESIKIVESTNVKIAEKNAEFMKMVAFIAAIVLIPGVLILQVMRRKKSMEEEFGTKSREQGERSRREMEELELRSQQETKERVDDELKKIIDQERSKLE